MYEEALEICKNIINNYPKLSLTFLINIYGVLSYHYLFIKEYLKSEQSVLLSLELDNTQISLKTNLAHALLFQNRFSEAEKIYKELSQTIKQGNETYTQELLNDFEELEKQALFPKDTNLM